MATWKKVVVSGSSAVLAGLTVDATISGDIDGNAATATALETARTINGQSFNGTANITVTAAGSTLSDTVTVAKGGTGLTSIADKSLIFTSDTDTFSALTAGASDDGKVVSYNNSTGNYELISAATGDITGVVSSTTNQLVVTDPTGPEPSLAITTAAILDGGTGLATADQIHSFVTTQTDAMAADTTGNAGTATALETARNIGGVSFDGTANINLPGVNTTGTQDTSGNAGTATALETARNIGGVSFDGTANINLPGVNTAGTQDTSGTAANATNAADSALLNGEDKAAMFTGPTFTGTTTAAALNVTGNVSLGDQLTDQVTVNGDLIVKGTASFENTENLLVKDRFITLASGSTDASGDGGIVVETSATNGGQGPAFAWNGGDSRWGVAALVQSDASSYAADAFMASVLKPAAANTAAAILAIDSNYNKKGNLYVASGQEDIWIYS